MFLLNRKCFQMEFDFVKNNFGIHSIIIKQPPLIRIPLWKLIFKTKSITFEGENVPYDDGKFELTKQRLYHFCIRDDGNKMMITIDNRRVTHFLYDYYADNWLKRTNDRLLSSVNMDCCQIKDDNVEDSVTNFAMTLSGRLQTPSPTVPPTSINMRRYFMYWKNSTNSTFDDFYPISLYKRYRRLSQMMNLSMLDMREK